MIFSVYEIIENLFKKDIFIMDKKPGVFRFRVLSTLFSKQGGGVPASMDRYDFIAA